MEHPIDTKGTYVELRRRVDRTQTGLPPSPLVYEILSHLFTEEEARIGAKLPIAPRRLGVIARRLDTTAGELKPKLERMADKGLVFDFAHPTRGDYYMLAPPVVGFFELSMMRVRSDIDQTEVARLLDTYLHERDEFHRAVAETRTPVGRALVHETALEPPGASDVLDWERATELVSRASMGAVSLCFCRHEKQHLGKPCSKPLEVCISLGRGADFIVRRGHGRRAERAEMLEILERCRREGLVQIADNVKREPTYICNCCGCCCGQLGAINHHGLARAVTTSSFVAAIQLDRCSGCGKCARACPIQAIALRPRAPHRREASKKKMAAEVDGEVCLGCGVCKAACTTGSLAMRRREARVLTPESTLERVLRMAMGRGHLHDLLFDEHDGPTSAFANRLVGAIEALSLTRRVMLNETLQSRFVGFLCRAAQAGSRTPAEMI